MTLIEYLTEAEETSTLQAKPATPITAGRIDPLKDPRWDEFVERHPRSSLFHSTEWLKALARTYQYQPVAYTTSPARHDLENAVVFCEVESWLTGDRLVSLPFSDHCEPLASSAAKLDKLLSSIAHSASELSLQVRRAEAATRIATGMHRL